MLSPADHDRIHAALAEAEAKTGGEIFCIVARESARYREIPLAAAAIAALLGPPLAIAFGLRSDALFGVLIGQWTAVHSAALQGLATHVVLGYATLQGVVFLAVLALAAVPALRRLLTPPAAKRAHVHARALEQFAHRRHASRAPTGVLIYASTAERRVEIIADEDIHDEVGQAFWDQTVAAAVAKIRHGDAAGGLIEAIERCGGALAEHFPRTGAAPAPAADDLAEV